MMCNRCGTEITPTTVSPGYAIVRTGTVDEKVCYACCAKLERENMRTTGRAVLYLTSTSSTDYEVVNWPGSLRFKVSRYRKGRQNMVGVRYDVWFVGPDNQPWWGVKYGDNTQIVHCKRTKGAR